MIKRTAFVFVLILFFTSMISADIIINQQPNSIYNLGDNVNLPINIVASNNLDGFLIVQLICSGKISEVHKEFISLTAGGEKQINLNIPLINRITNASAGTCVIKTIFREEFLLTTEFKVSDFIATELKLEKTEFNPGENIVLSGKTSKENKKPVNGVVELNIISNDLVSNINLLGTVAGGFFSLNFSLPENTKAGQYLVKVNVYEKDFEGQITNKGFSDYNIRINQVPKSLEIVFNERNVLPNNNLKAKAILHDQTGENIESIVIITIKNSKNKIVKQSEEATDRYIEYLISYNELPSEWDVVAVSNKLTTESKFNILGKMDAKITIDNQTLTVTNIGNVPYNSTVVVKIGEEYVNVPVYLNVDKSEKYRLTAPDGRYLIEVLIDDKENQGFGEFSLTGKTIDVKKSSGVTSFFSRPFVWVFILLILVLIAFIILKKGYKKSFIGYITKKRQMHEVKDVGIPLTKGSLVNSRNSAELSLSIKGEKQDASVISLHIKNLAEIQSKKGNAKDVLQKIVDFAEEKKAATYEDHDNILLIFAPTITRTFRNEKTALEVAEKISERLKQHNKLFNQKIDFGISLNHGAIVAKKESHGMKFMSVGNLISKVKRLSSHSHEEIFISEEMNANLLSHAKTEKHEHNGLIHYTIKELKHTNPEHKKFISNFLHGLEEDKKKLRK